MTKMSALYYNLWYNTLTCTEHQQVVQKYIVKNVQYWTPNFGAALANLRVMLCSAVQYIAGHCAFRVHK